MNRFGYRALVGATTALLAAVSASAASAQTTYYACRVPGVNIIYIRGTLVTDTCIDGAHVPFQWTDGGAPGANSVNSAAIIDGTIATADLANGSVTAAKIANGAVSNWKTASFSGSGISATAGTINNIQSITFNAPSAGTVWVNASGYCNVTSAGTQIAVIWGVSATERWSFGPSAFFQGSAIGQIPFGVSRVQAVTAGSNTLYLNVENFTGGGTSCYGTSILAFTATQLP